MSNPGFDQAMMRQAINQAQNAQIMGEVPVGAVLVRDGQVLATGYNHPIGMHDPTRKYGPCGPPPMCQATTGLPIVSYT